MLGAGLALSSATFVLQLLKERGGVGKRFGSAVFSILLFQDFAIVPKLGLIPLYADSGGVGVVMQAISVASAKAAEALAFMFFHVQVFSAAGVPLRTLYPLNHRFNSRIFFCVKKFV